MKKRIAATILTFLVACFAGSALYASGDIGQCMGDCASEQGTCIAQCQGDGQCIIRCGDAHGRCVSRCN